MRPGRRSLDQPLALRVFVDVCRGGALVEGHTATVTPRDLEPVVVFRYVSSGDLLAVQLTCQDGDVDDVHCDESRVLHHHLNLGNPWSRRQRAAVDVNIWRRSVATMDVS